MLYGVTANRMTLMRTRKRLATARRGHTLMKHKMEELMRIFQVEIEHARALEGAVHTQLQHVYSQFLLGSAQTDSGSLRSLLVAAAFRIGVKVVRESVLNLRLPVLRCTTAGERPPYGLFASTDDLDESARALERSFPLLLQLAQAHRRLAQLIGELETTRRRVNALEYVLIPRLDERAAVIQMKLDEIERSNVSRLMRIKSVIRKEV